MEKEYKNLHTLTKEQLEVIKLVAEIQDKKYASGMFRFLDMLQKIAAIITPFILFYLGSRFNAQQRIDGEEKEKINRVATLIKSLSSENLSEKQLAFSYARYLATKGLYPKEMINAISVAANQDSTGALATDARSLLTTLKTAKYSVEAVNQASAQIKARIFIQYAKGSDNAKQMADNAAVILSNAGYKIPPKEAVAPAIVPSTPELRYYHHAEDQDIMEVKSMLYQHGVNIVVKYVSGFENNDNVKAYTYELWIK